MAKTQVRVEHVNPFVEAVHELFSTMLGAAVERGNVSLLGKDAKPREIVGIIGISGETRGIVTVAFPRKTAMSVVGTLLGTDLAEFDETVSDGVAEVVNMIAGRPSRLYRLA